ncbi:MAG: hypothetical protein F6J87_26815 [Spirulina sp. SIO3F2]|nr:hypothetical protein [Spirulina sp. SIO3F2]
MSLFRQTSTRNSRAKRHDFFIKERDLAIALELEWQVFDQLIEPMFQAAESIGNLKESQDFIYHDRRQQIRLFYQEGALAIAAL